MIPFNIRDDITPPVIINFKVRSNTSINSTNPAVASASVSDINLKRVTFGIIDKSNLLDTNMIIFGIQMNESDVSGKYVSKKWAGYALWIKNATKEDIVTGIVTENSPDYNFIISSFKKNYSTVEEEALLWFNIKTDNLSKITRMNSPSTVVIESGKSTFRVSKSKLVSGWGSEPSFINEKTFTLYNIGNPKNPHIIIKTVPSGTYSVFVRAEDIMGNSNGKFIDVKVSTDTLTITSPNGGQIWPRGTTQTIRWNYSGTPGSRVKIELLKNEGQNRVIATNTSNDGEYNWSINSTQTLGVDYKIRVTSTNKPAYTDKSNKNFIIDDLSLDINKKLILVGVDGFSQAKYKSMYPQLKNFSYIVNNGGWNRTLKITGHTKTETAPGNAELMTGLKESQNGVSSNNGSKIVDGKTIWERLEVYNSSIVTGSVYGKNNAYITTPLFDNAIPDIDWWQTRNTYGARIWPCGTSVDYDVDVANKATEFIKQYNKNSFFLVVYFASTDGSGHYCGGDTGQNYTDSFINVDRGLGILLNSLKDNGIDTMTQIIITGDHGWNPGTTGHGTANNDTRILPLITNNITMLRNVTSNGLREQGEVAPTILDFFGMATSDYQDITNAGYQSMRAH